MKLKNQNNLWGFLLVVPMLFLAILLIVGIDDSPAKTESEPIPAPVATSSEPEFAETPRQDFYTIKTTENGSVGVYKGNETKPSIVLHEIVLMALPKIDREKLKNGITVYSDEELYSLIEDLDS